MVDKEKSVPISLLYVEDEPVTRELVARMLGRFDIQLHLAANGKEGLDIYQNIRPDIVVSDVLMPVMTGLEMAREIRAGNALAQIVIVSSHSDTEVLLEAIDIGIKHFVLKPLEMRKLSAVVDDCIVFVQMQRLLNRQNHKISMLYDAMEQSSDMILIVDTTGTIEYVNHSFCQVTGYQPAEVVGKNPRILDSGENPSPVFEHLWSTISAGNAWHGELLNTKKNGEVYWEEMTISPVKTNDGTIAKYLKIGSDVTERKKLLEEVIRARKLETIATFAGGIAHDFNNLLQIMMGNLYIIQSELDAGNSLKLLAADAYAASLRAKELNIKLLEFARQDKAVFDTVHLGKLFEDAAALFLRETDVAIDNMLPLGLWPVIGDRVQIGQVVTNLLINAREAMPHGGVVTVQAENIVVQRSNDLPLQTGRYVRIAITDQGVGIPEEDLTRVFDPYFSTKTLASRKGNGLGLAICHTVVSNHGGMIRIESVNRAGATVLLYLPADPRHGENEHASELNNDRSHNLTTGGNAGMTFS